MLPRPPASDFEYYPEVAKAKLYLLVTFSHGSARSGTFLYFDCGDLAHRVYPFFPEVSLYGEFGRREDMFRRYLQRRRTSSLRTRPAKKKLLRSTRWRKIGCALFIIRRPLSRWRENLPRSGKTFASVRNRPRFPPLFRPTMATQEHVLLLLMLDILRKEHGENLQLVLTGSDRGNFAFLTHNIAQLGLQNQVVLAGFSSVNRSWLPCTKRLLL